jgi:cytoplasmic iron level regulating protein YaaA (DUF328/UPF0246 family)
MLSVLSPAKSLEPAPAPASVPSTQPALIDQAESLMRTTRGLTQKKIRELMNLSADLAKLNYDRFHNFDLPQSDDNALPAALTFNGDVYRGLDARSLPPDDLSWSQEHIAILSGLYGLLRPLDLIQPHRLEMGTRLKTRRGANLYSFWGDRISKRISTLVDGHADPTLVNLASNEYFKSVKAKTLKIPVVECVFEDYKGHPDEGRVISFMAKQARGRMARFIISKRIDRATGLKEFNAARYVFQPKRSTDTRFTFTRKFIPVAEERNP